MFNLKTFIAVTTMVICGVSAIAQDAVSSVDNSVPNGQRSDNQANSYSSAQIQCIEGGYLELAQELGYLPYPYNFIQVQGGVGTTLTDVNCFKLLTPTLSIGVGRMFSPLLGARVHVNGWKSTGGFDNIVGLGNTVKKYKYNYINSNIDLLVNISNMFSPNVNSPFAIYFIGGLGLNYAWHNNEFENLVSQYQVGSDISNAWGNKQNLRHNLLGHNFRAGILADVNLSKSWSAGAEIDFNSLDDHFNSKYTNSDDWMITAQLSITYKFGHSKKIPQNLPPTIINNSPTPKYEQNGGKEDPQPAPPPTPKVGNQTVNETIFYALRESDLTSEAIINKVAEWCKNNPQKTITIDGYADKGTGNPKINEGYAKLRAEKVAAALKGKGVPASQMIVKSHGDTIQPFPENDKNRCVIIEGK